MLQKLLYNLQGWLAEEDVQGTCPMCTLVIFNVFANPIYHQQNFCPPCSPRNIGRWMLASRPQVSLFTT